MKPITVNEAVDLYIGDLARQRKSPRTLASYERLLLDLARTLSRQALVAELGPNEYRRFLDRWIHSSPSTMASGVSIVKGFSRWLFANGFTESDVAAFLERPKRQRAEDLDVVSIDGSEVQRMLAACESEQELICVATAAYLGPRRAALSMVRRRDVDLRRGTIRFREKGGKIATKRMPDEFASLVAELDHDGMWASPDAYLIPNRRPAAMRREGERSDKVIWLTVKRVAERCGVRSTVHALRAAFAVQFDRQHPDQIFALKELMGHARLETTAVYLRRKDREAAIDLNRDLSWGSGSVSCLNPDARNPAWLSEKAHTGFEPVFAGNSEETALVAKLAELRSRTQALKAGSRTSQPVKRRNGGHSSPAAAPNGDAARR